MNAIQCHNPLRLDNLQGRGKNLCSPVAYFVTAGTFPALIRQTPNRG